MKTQLMPITRLWRLLSLAGLVLAFVSSVPAALQSPQSVRGALRILNQVVGHTGRLVQSKDYDKVAGEHPEFTEGAAMLREAIRGEPADFTAKVESALDAAVVSSEAMGKIAATGDAAKAEAAHADFATKVKAVINLFPEDVRPKPRQKK